MSSTTQGELLFEDTGLEPLERTRGLLRAMADHIEPGAGADGAPFVACSCVCVFVCVCVSWECYGVVD